MTSKNNDNSKYRQKLGKGSAGPEPAADTLLSEQVFRHKLAAMITRRILVDFTCNRASLVRVSLVRGVLQIRIQHAFRAADDKTLKALADFVQKPDASSQAVLKDFVRRNGELISFFAGVRHSGNGDASLETPLQGKVESAAGSSRNLSQVLAKVASDYGLDAKGIGITWSGSREIYGRRRTSIRFGSFNSKTRLIRIHPLLDSPDVPDFFVEFIVYHELLHAVFPPACQPGRRRSIHTGQFKHRERLFARYDDAVAFERQFAREKLGMRLPGPGPEKA
jgi:hypothetical protein